MGFAEWYHHFNVELADKRVVDWPLVGSPIPLSLMTFAYLYFVLQCGPRYMKDKQPYSFTTFIKLYNLFQIIVNAMVVYHSFEVGWYRDYFIYCVEPDYTSNPTANKIASIIWWVYMIKIVDFIETIMFVLRKKTRQVSVLHLYHHVSTVYFAWLSTKFWAHGMALTIIILNCSVHVIMYTYYLLSNFGPKVQRYLQPIKPIITISQMVQFVIMISYSIQGLLPYCSRQFSSVATIGLINLIINFALFYNFYKTAYKSKKTKTK